MTPDGMPEIGDWLVIEARGAAQILDVRRNPFYADQYTVRYEDESEGIVTGHLIREISERKPA